ncbi:MAG TPA: serine hydrolase [Terracidiphilus sp.]|nr:serine hydrolase [Terracidiphilus sp.]
MNVEATPSVPPLANKFSVVYRVLEDAIAAHAFPGCAFGVLAGGNLVLQGARGSFTYDEASPPVTPSTVYDLASVTKVAATTAAAMLLHQCGLLHLDTLLGDLLPAFVAGRASTDSARRVTLRHLLAHNSGLPGYVEFFRTVTTPSALLDACLQLPLQAEPGARAEYSDPGFILLGKAIEACTGELLPAWVQREVFQPLNLASTCFSPTTAARHLIPPTEEDTSLRHRRIQGEVQDENAWVLGGAAGHAGLFSNVPDLLKFAAAILHSRFENVRERKEPSLSNGETIFNPQTVETFAERQKPQGSSRALGWDTPSSKSSSGKHFSPHSIGHLGYSGCSLWIDLEAAIAVVLLTNRTWPDRPAAAGQLIREIRPAFHNAIREAL